MPWLAFSAILLVAVATTVVVCAAVIAKGTGLGIDEPDPKSFCWALVLIPFWWLVVWGLRHLAGAG